MVKDVATTSASGNQEDALAVMYQMITISIQTVGSN